MKVKTEGRSRDYRTVTFDSRNNAVRLIDQRRLPHCFELTETKEFRDTAHAIRDMVVRGAGAIAATAAYGLAQGVAAFQGTGLREFSQHTRRVFSILADARPTAIDPITAMRRVMDVLKRGRTVDERKALALAAAEEFAEEDVRHCQAIGRQGSRLICDGMTVLTHCNAGWLAFVDVGSATAPLYAAQAEGRKFRVLCDETRPRCQGASLTAWELAQQGIEHRIIADNAAGHFMQRGAIDLVIVGSDRTVGRTGEVANKIGTYSKAVLAHRHRIPFYVAIPLSTIDWELRSGKQIPIEERSEDEVLGAWGLSRSSGEANSRSRCARMTYVRIANPQSTALNPGFDVTPPELITGIITPLGIFNPQELWERRRELRAYHTTGSVLAP